MKGKIFLALLLFVLLSCAPGNAQEQARIYGSAVEAVRSGDIDFAFMHFRSLLTNYPHSQHREQALFAIAEYYFMMGDYHDAAEALMSFIDEYPDAKGRVFALAYLLAIAKKQGNEPSVKDLEKKLVTSRQQVFLFKNSKTYRYKSPLNRKHAAVYYIDKLEFYADDTLFATLSY